jgi:hypothetical protein
MESTHHENIISLNIHDAIRDFEQPTTILQWIQLKHKLTSLTDASIEGRYNEIASQLDTIAEELDVSAGICSIAGILTHAADLIRHQIPEKPED